MMNKTIEKNINYEKCKNVVKSLNDYYKGNKDLANIEFPSNIIINSHEYYLYIFYSCLLNYGMRSKVYNQNLINTYKDVPNLFNPNYIITLNEESLKSQLIKNIHPRYPNVGTRKWMELSKQLIQYKNLPDDLKILKSIGELNEFIKGIKGYGRKTGNLLIRMIRDSKICNFTEEIESIPIDRHDIEISYLTGITNKLKLNDKEIEDLSNAYVESGNDLNISPSNIDKYLWELGATLCTKKKCSECPLNIYCKNVQNKSKEV